MDRPTILITAGTSGLGRAMVERLAAEGRNVAFSFRSDEPAARELEAVAVNEPERVFNRVLPEGTGDVRPK